jgi:hypothetical protein
MGNLIFEVNNLENKLAIGEKQKAMLQEELGLRERVPEGV